MATTMFFEGVLKNVRPDDNKTEIEFEFGRSSFYGDNLIYFSIDDKQLIIDKKTGEALCRAMRDLGIYLGYD